MRVYCRHGEKFYRLTVSQRWAEQHDNGALVSCGLEVGKDLTERSLKALVQRGQAVEVTKDEWNHSGCQSSCVLRGAQKCSW